MPTDGTRSQNQILELPGGLSQDELHTLLNDRLRDINGVLKTYLENPALGDADLGQHRIINLADPKDDLDGVNLRTLKRSLGQGATTTVTGTGSGTAPYTMVFTKDGFVDDGELSPSFTVNAGRDGYSPSVVSLTADLPAPSTPLTVNLLVNGAPLLSVDLSLAVGATGPVYSQKFKIPGGMPIGTKVRAQITGAGGAGQVVVELVMVKG